MAVSIDRVDLLNLVERLGVVRSLTRRARVRFTPNDDPCPADYSVLTAALDQCPSTFSKFNDWGKLVGDRFNSLVLVERSANLAEGDINCVDVDLKYEHVLDGPHQLLVGDLKHKMLYGKGKTSIAQKSTNSYYPDDNRDLPRQLIVVGHNFKSPNGIQNNRVAASGIENPKLPFVREQTGEVELPFPQSNFHINGVLRTKNPWAVNDKFIRKINKLFWMNHPPGQWICSEVEHDILETLGGVETYHFAFEFQLNVDGWNPTVIFKDQETGRPPADVVTATTADAFGVVRFIPHAQNGLDQPAGLWTVPALEPVDFNSLFNAIFE